MDSEINHNRNNNSNYDIICLQETWWDDDFVNSFVKFQWEGDILFSNSENTRARQSDELPAFTTKTQTL